jgi:HSP20 family protein
MYTNPLVDIHDEIDRIFSDFAEETRRPMRRSDWSEAPQASTWLPPIEVSETEREMVVDISLPGVKPENINVEVVGNTLILSGETRREQKQNETHFHRSEFQYGHFVRRLSLPDYVASDHCAAEYHNGILEVRIPKIPEASRKRIEVKHTGNRLRPS